MTPDDTLSLRNEIDDLVRALPKRIDANAEGIDTGLARLVLTLIEFLRQVLEHQAVRRLDAGTLTEEEQERLGLAFLRMRERMVELRDTLGVAEEDLNLDLGPLGRLL
jgi:hypothetical protein